MKFIIIFLLVFIIFAIFSYKFLLKLAFRAFNIRVQILSLLFVIFVYLLVVLFMFLRKFDISENIFIALSTSILLLYFLFFAAFINALYLLISHFIPKLKDIRIHITWMLLVGVFCVFIYSIFNASKLPKVVNEEIIIENLKHDISILQIADLHLSKLITENEVKNIIKLANSTKPDIIVLVGDIIDAPDYDIEHLLEHLKSLHAKYGVYFVLGNHEFIHNAYKSIELMQNIGITPLVNNSIVINDNINLLGLSDLVGERYKYLEPSLSDALKEVNPMLPIVLLSHQPNTIHLISNYFNKECNTMNSKDSKKCAKIDLLLSGHTHGGQLAPFSFLVYLANPFLYGLKTIDDIQVYITQGAHFAVTYGRFGTSSEINLINLRSKK